MLKILGGRSSGKTSAIIELCKKFGGLLIVDNMTAKNNAIMDCVFDAKKVFTVEEVLKHSLYGKMYDVYIDVVDYSTRCNLREHTRDVGQIKAVTIQE